MSFERDPLGGGPAEAIAAIQRSNRGLGYESAPRSGNPARGLTDVQGLNKQFVPKGQMLDFQYHPDLLPTGLLNPGPVPSPTGGYYAGCVVRKLVDQRLIGWTREIVLSNSSQPVDGYTGKAIRLGGGYDPNSDYVQVVAQGDAK